LRLLKENETTLVELQIDLATTPFDLDATLCCGQVFRWERAHKYWYGVIGETIVKIKQEHHTLIFQTYPNDLGISFIERYFRFQDDLPKILKNIDRDEYINAAIRELFGLRLIRQEPWECLISYICATNANISRIKDMIRGLSRMLGEKILFKGKTFYTFPTRKALAGTTLKNLLNCNLGYRAKNILKIAKLIHNNQFNLEGLKRLTYDKGRHQLLTLKGVGPKVADCILLFSQDKLEAFPVDVWIKRIITAYYTQHIPQTRLHLKDGQSLKNKQISEFGRQYFGRYAGYAQEYLYAYYRGRMRKVVTKI
jgi:N-glycosylase/DNA lyase